MPNTAAYILAAAKYQAMGFDTTAALDAVLRQDALEVRMDKPCGKSHISDRKKCSPDKLKQLTADLKAGDTGAKRRVAEGKKSAQRKQELRRAVERDAGKKSEPLDKSISNRDIRGSSKGETKMELPKLEGSEKQVAWAENIRNSAIAASRQILDVIGDQLVANSKGDWKQISVDALERMHTNASAKAWIDAKDDIDKLVKTAKAPHAIQPANVVLIKRIAEKLKPKKVIGAK